MTKALLNFGKPIPQPKCKHCGKDKDLHLAKTGGCPFGFKSRTVGYTNYHKDQTFAPKKEPA